MPDEKVTHETARKSATRMRLADERDQEAYSALARYIDQQVAKEEQAEREAADLRKLADGALRDCAKLTRERDAAQAEVARLTEERTNLTDALKCALSQLHHRGFSNVAKIIADGCGGVSYQGQAWAAKEPSGGEGCPECHMVGQHKLQCSRRNEPAKPASETTVPTRVQLRDPTPSKTPPGGILLLLDPPPPTRLDGGKGGEAWYVVENDGSYSKCLTEDDAKELLTHASAGSFITTTKPAAPPDAADKPLTRAEMVAALRELQAEEDIYRFVWKKLLGMLEKRGVR